MDVSATIKEILASEVLVDVPVHEMKADDRLRDGYGVDSLGFVELRVQCEERLGVSISDEEFSPENFETVGSVVSLVERLRDEQRSQSLTEPH
ncbi:coronafacic acid synthetase [Streptomyces longispororuber]|uniref:Coronafacic acid synthetase n=1 Tax=Streptomyces longispororuber TaxID=68230 RepID=A0A919DIU2_9ACTN|nr:acyl carrier protein [Streptomyces longispororuber]GHE48649.1 coronafacic acid synthetase [Streptomyces longispororuber]